MTAELAEERPDFAGGCLAGLGCLLPAWPRPGAFPDRRRAHGGGLTGAVVVAEEAACGREHLLLGRAGTAPG
ncbi:hypothetical protein OOK58_00540 [Streptomyces sp. NBC_01728]|uniref:hypothetical protein n=1 Tax=unclassified Streptomyces TaxID=2593676 RepID=UPI002254EDE8|nr:MULTISPECIES: hypothetical protein [unclassified Streptomyces]MCX4461209.1 hypothetical protein [Streptomyces sp. NBC_01719]MCX4490117.1 hypothetical protein [Streptomyces sp. NBC_01728]MCX4596866.1 hypothetical protein [Streptomyces sp. NBC_01549]